ncbi:GRIP1-associated protein 1 isoform X1, partial [Tachysurus ichikawai]
MEGTKGWIERRLKEAEETIEKNRLQHTEEIERLQREQALQLEEKSREFDAVKQQITAMDKEKEELNNTIAKQKQVPAKKTSSSFSFSIQLNAGFRL